MEKVFANRVEATESGLRAWIRKNGTFKMKGAHKLVLLGTKAINNKVYWICEDAAVEDGEVKGKFLILAGLFTELQERAGNEDVEILITNDEGKVTITDKESFKMDDEGMLQIA